MSYIRIDDPVFDERVTLRDAYRIFERFVNAFEARGDVAVAAFSMYMGLANDGIAGDPAALDDFLDAVRESRRASGAPTDDTG